MKETIDRLSLLFIDVGKALTFIVAFGVVVYVAADIWFSGTSLTVVNETGDDLEGVLLLVGNSEVGQHLIWRSDLSQGETDWAYTFLGGDRAVLQYAFKDIKIEAECLYESGAAISARMVIAADEEMLCESDMRWPFN